MLNELRSAPDYGDSIFPHPSDVTLPTDSCLCQHNSRANRHRILPFRTAVPRSYGDSIETLVPESLANRCSAFLARLFSRSRSLWGFNRSFCRNHLRTAILGVSYLLGRSCSSKVIATLGHYRLRGADRKSFPVLLSALLALLRNALVTTDRCMLIFAINRARLRSPRPRAAVSSTSNSGSLPSWAFRTAKRQATSFSTLMPTFGAVNDSAEYLPRCGPCLCRPARSD